MEYSLKILAEMINKLDSYYEFSDNPRRQMRGTDEESDIAHWLHGLGAAETEEVLMNLDETGEFNYKRYFKNK